MSKFNHTDCYYFEIMSLDNSCLFICCYENIVQNKSGTEDA